MALTDEEKRRIFEEEKLRKEMAGKSVAVSVILSFLIPGFGDLYCGSWIKALIFFALDFLAFILMFAAGIGIFIFAPVWVCGLISAWLSANKKSNYMRRALQNE
jgi:TM2 domain-containing membrane protein YozV